MVGFDFQVLGHQCDYVWLAYGLTQSDWQGVVVVGLVGIFFGDEFFSWEVGHCCEDGWVGNATIHELNSYHVVSFGCEFMIVVCGYHTTIM